MLLNIVLQAGQDVPGHSWTGRDVCSEATRRWSLHMVISSCQHPSNPGAKADKPAT